MKDSSRNWQISVILCTACVLTFPFNVAELYIYFKFGVFEPYTYIMAIPFGGASFLLVQTAVAIALYRRAWIRTHSMFLFLWLINISVFGVLIWSTAPEQAL
ncbi:hypothetical protein [Pseudomonas fluorescens]|uniref:Uncharacterized protein n=1 Tax=Pseudomonas fluorescens TaxID=294 RepID=A0A5E7E227_PSEFL|nr:hypothetical protein [Pseudomonas fluorescens]VVO18274.1 hypothetical protein PS723_03994 [Pseudomonas fluorescens]